MYLPETITIDFRIEGAPSERLLLHTKSSVYKAEVSNGHTYNLRHYFHKYQKAYCLDTVCSDDADLLQFCFVAVGERTNIPLQRVLKTCDESQLKWVGRVDPAMTFMIEKIKEVAGPFSSDQKAALIVELMEHVLRHGLPFMSRYTTFRTVVIDKCKELRETHGFEFGNVRRSCTAVLKALDVISDEEVAIENWNALPHKDLILYIRLNGYPPQKNVLFLDMTPMHHRQILVRYLEHHSLPVPAPLSYDFAELFKNYYLTPDGHCNLYDMLCNWKVEDAFLLDYDKCSEPYN